MCVELKYLKLFFGKKNRQQQHSAANVRGPESALSPDNRKNVSQEEVSLSVTPVLVGVFVVCMCGMLLLLYFFRTYLGRITKISYFSVWFLIHVSLID